VVGWGVEGVSFHHEDKPAFRPFLIKIIDLDVNTPPVSPMSLEPLPISAPLIRDQLLAELIDAAGADNVVQHDLDRIVHTYGKSATDLLRIRAGDISRVPDVLVDMVGPSVADFRRCSSRWRGDPHLTRAHPGSFGGRCGPIMAHRSAGAHRRRASIGRGQRR
jgi:hypothetical protein